MLKNIFFAAIALSSFAACDKHDPICEPNSESGSVTVSFVNEPNTTRAFFDASATEA